MLCPNGNCSTEITAKLAGLSSCYTVRGGVLAFFPPDSLTFSLSCLVCPCVSHWLYLQVDQNPGAHTHVQLPAHGSATKPWDL